MPEIQQDIEPLVAGDKLTWEEFEARWDAMPELKHAELIGGVVYIMSPVGRSHSRRETDVAVWLRRYAAKTPGTECGMEATWRMLGDAPQPDGDLRILEECGGKSHVEGEYTVGAPELVVEVCHSSAAYDLHQKKELYHRAGVDEYVTILLHEGEIRWHRWSKKDYVVVPVAPDGILRSRVFPGLWLDVKALLEGDIDRVDEVLQQGLLSPEHAAFVQTLARRKAGEKT